ncbi:MAG: (Fe-S)-binding protein, partial [Desulfobacteraceae bacterium]|nr:(Fe-S)-binding protein [Desulfobacteraceae bacterium]
LSFFKKIIFRYLISKPERFDKLISFIEKFQFIIAKNNKNTNKTASFRFIPPLIKTRRFKKIAKIPFHKTEYSSDFKSENSRIKVTFFPGCAIDKIFPGIAVDTVKILQHYKVDVYIPSHQGCCGIPALASGDQITFTNLLDLHIDALSKKDFQYLITPCATCLSTIKNLWPNIYKSEDKEKKEFLLSLSEKALDISQFLINILKVPDIVDNNISGCVTYHDPCHHKKGLNIETEPRKLISASGKNLVEMEKSDSCCGMGGTFNLAYYEESLKIGKLKGNSIIATGCKTVATSCPACMMQLADILDKQKAEIRIKHPVEIYKQALLDN